MKNSGGSSTSSVPLPTPSACTRIRLGRYAKRSRGLVQFRLKQDTLGTAGGEKTEVLGSPSSPPVVEKATNAIEMPNLAGIGKVSQVQFLGKTPVFRTYQRSRWAKLWGRWLFLSSCLLTSQHAQDKTKQAK